MTDSSDKAEGRDRSDDIDLIAVLLILWSNKFLIASIAAVGVAISAVLALTSPPVYRAEVVITEVQSSPLNAMSGIANQFGGLASLAGVNLSSSNSTRDSIAILQSRHLAEQFILRNGIMTDIYPEGSQQASLWMAVNKFRESFLSIQQDRRNGTITIAIMSSDPAKASTWANAYVALANETLRARALEEANRNISYLTKQIERTAVVEVKRAMYNLIESETKTLMLATGRSEYAFTVVDPAVQPEIRVRPKRTFMVLLGVVIGLAMGIGFVLVRSMVRNARH